jgi:nuclear pore complex protein Nup188
LAQSSLLGPDGSDSRIIAVVGAAEIPTGRHGFLLGCVRVFDTLIEDAHSHPVARKRNTGVSARFGTSSLEISGTNITENTMKDIILRFERIIVDVFESCRNWRFVSLEERLMLNELICKIFDKILSYSFIVDDNQDISSKLQGFLAPAVDHLLNVFLSQSTNGLPIQPLIQILLEGATTPTSTISAKTSHRWVTQTQACLGLCTTLIQVNRYLGRGSSFLEQQLFKVTPMLAKLYAAHMNYRLPVVSLLEALVRRAGGLADQPPSLLGHLGQGTAKSFMQMLLVLNQPLNSTDLSNAIWRLLSAVVSQRQQWFAIYLLTGDTPKDALRDKSRTKEPSKYHVQPMLDIASERLIHFDQQDPREALYVLEFVSLAVDFWPWVVPELLKKPALTSALMEQLDKLKPHENNNNPRTATNDPNQIQIVSFVVDILAMYVHHSHQRGEQKLSKEILPRLAYLVKLGVSRPSFNASLHSILRKNFEMRYPGCSLSNFKRTNLKKPFLGDDFYYDMETANQVLAHDSAWTGKGGQGFAKEFIRANENLSVVEAQVVS